MAFLGGTIQVVMAIALVIMLGVVAFLVYNAEMLKAIQDSGKVRREVPIFTGIKDFALTNNEEYSTIDTNNPLYRNLENSVNQKAGAEYTYNFWLYMNSPPGGEANITRDDIKTDVGLTKANTKTELDAANRPFVLLLRGSKQAVPYKSLCSESNANQLKVDVLVKQPMIKLERNYDVLTVELNTQTKPDGVKEKSRNTCQSNDGSWDILNSYRIGVSDLKSKMTGKWNMITVVVQDTFPTDPLPIRNKVRVRVYINGTLEVDRYVDGKLADTSSQATLLRTNRAPLHVAPQIAAVLTPGSAKTPLSKQLESANTNQLMMADLTYFNYAVDDVQIKSLFNAKFAKKYALAVSSSNSSNALPSAFTAEVGDAYDSANFKQIGQTA